MQLQDLKQTALGILPGFSPPIGPAGLVATFMGIFSLFVECKPGLNEFSGMIAHFAMHTNTGSATITVFQ